MSSLARFFKLSGVYTEGYDKTASIITDKLIKEDNAYYCYCSQDELAEMAGKMNERITGQ